MRIFRASEEGGPLPGAPFNSLFEMPLQRRAAWLWHVHHLSILYLRCAIRVFASNLANASFNSLFEMLEHHENGKKRVCYIFQFSI